MTEESEVFVLTRRSAFRLFVCVCLSADYGYGHTHLPKDMKFGTNVLGTKVERHNMCK